MKKNISGKITRYQQWIETALKNCAKPVKTRDLRDPIQYVLGGQGKRIRPLFTLLACELAGGDPKSAISAATGIELLHNFTLVHDDIMDRDENRRGRPTVHTKWDEGTAILTGDGILGLAYKILIQSPPPAIAKIASIFSQTIVELCEGQALDKEFERRTEVSLNEYQKMISLKTARLFQSSAEIGAIIGGGTGKQIKNISNFAWNIGMAFQIQDDLLDVVGEETVLGKDVGSDIVSGKKTFLIIECLNRCPDPDREFLIHFRPEHPLRSDSLNKIREIFKQTGTIEFTQKAIRRYYRRALSYLTGTGKSPSVESFRYLVERMISREF